MTLNEQQRGALLQTIGTAGYQVFLDLGNDECEVLVTELLSVDEANHASILAKHIGARFARKFFDKLCERVEREAKSILKPQETKPLPLDFIPEARKGDLPDDFIPEEYSGKRGPVITG